MNRYSKVNIRLVRLLWVMFQQMKLFKYRMWLIGQTSWKVLRLENTSFRRFYTVTGHLQIGSYSLVSTYVVCTRVSVKQVLATVVEILVQKSQFTLNSKHFKLGLFLPHWSSSWSSKYICISVRLLTLFSLVVLARYSLAFISTFPTAYTCLITLPDKIEFLDRETINVYTSTST